MKPVVHCTLATIGKKVGKTKATVSMALRNDPRISSKTRAQIKKVAKSLGYMPDPLLSALVARKRTMLTSRKLANLAVIIDDNWRLDAPASLWLDGAVEGMRSACLKYGYNFLELSIEKDFKTVANPDRLLRARGVRGVVIPSFFNRDIQIKLNWGQYSVITVGSHPTTAFHRVGTDLSASMESLCHELAGRGYQRLGLAHSYNMEKSHRFEWLAALYKERYLVPERFQTVAPYLPQSFSKDGFLSWIETHKPDCIISNEAQSYYLLKEAGYRIPGEIGYVNLTTTGISKLVSGMCIDYNLLGSICIEHLHSFILRGEMGVPDNQQEFMIYSKWKDNGSVRMIRAKEQRGAGLISPRKAGKR